MISQLPKPINQEQSRIQKSGNQIKTKFTKKNEKEKVERPIISSVAGLIMGILFFKTVSLHSPSIYNNRLGILAAIFFNTLETDYFLSRPEKISYYNIWKCYHLLLGLGLLSLILLLVSFIYTFSFSFKFKLP